jgi:hypothetical protein
MIFICGRAQGKRSLRCKCFDLKCELAHNLGGDAGEFAARMSAGGAFNQHLAHRGDVVFEHACKMRLEGIVSKRLGLPYRSGRTDHWVKVGPSLS